MIKLLIADDHALVREGLRQIFASTRDIVVVGEAATGHEVLEKIGHNHLDLLLLDMSMPGPSGGELIKRVKSGNSSLPVLVVSMHNEGLFVARAIKAGASGYLTKDSDPEMLLTAIRKVAGGGKFLDPTLAEEMVFGANRSDEKPLHELLSDREYQVFLMVVSGKSNQQIADELCLSIKTISTHKSRLMQKAGLHGNADLIRYALKHHLVE